MNLLKTIFICLFATVPLFAQTNEWVKIETENKEISFSVPADFSYNFDKDGFYQFNPRNFQNEINYKNLRSITASVNGVTMFFESYDSKDSKRGLDYLMSNHTEGGYSRFNFDNFNVLRILDEKVNFKTYFYFASEQNTYLFGIGSRDKNNQTINRFLTSIRVNNKVAFTANNTFPVPTQTLTISNLQETPIKITELSKDERKKLEEAKKQKTSIVPVETPKNEGVLVFFKPRANYTLSARRSAEQGQVQLRITFLANGQIGDLTVVKGLENGLTQNAIRAAKRIRFLPAQENNVPKTVVKTVIYDFSLF